MRYKDKKDWIIPYVRGKRVLDLGCVEHDMGATKRSGWLHGIIRNHAASVVGVDYLQDEISALKKEGYDVVCADVETMDLGDKFEVIVAGDIVEHLSNCGKFMERVRGHLAPGGVFLITTPNPFNLLRFMRLFVKGRLFENQEHAIWFTPNVMAQLAGRYDFKITDLRYVDDSHLYYKMTFLWAPFLLLNYLLCLFRPQFCETLCFALKNEKE